MPTRLNPFYRSDILSFIPHWRLDRECRYVSRNFNGTVVSGTEAGRLPRRKFRCIDIRVTLVNPKKLRYRELAFDGNGYSSELPFWRNWHDPSHEHCYGWHNGDHAQRSSMLDVFGCCEWVQPLSATLAGQLLFPAFSDDAEISINVMPCNARTTRGVCLAFRNELSEKTAFSLVHLLHHLKGTVASTANIIFDMEGVEDSSCLSHSFVTLLRDERMKFHVVDARAGRAHLNEAEMRTLSELAYIGAFHVGGWADELFASLRVNKRGPPMWTRESHGDAFFDFVLRAGDYCRTLKLELHHSLKPPSWAQLETGGAFFDAMIEKFESGIEQIGCHAISKLIFTYGLLTMTSLNEGDDAWPKRCPLKAAVKVIECIPNEESESEFYGSETDEVDGERMERLPHSSLSPPSSPVNSSFRPSHPTPSSPSMELDESSESEGSGEETSEETRNKEMAEMLEMDIMQPSDSSTVDDEEYSSSSSSSSDSFNDGHRYRVGEDEEVEEGELGESYHLYEFAFENVHSREPFRVVLKTVLGKENAIDTVEFILR